MIVGERCDIKTSLLFLTAITAASELGVKVLFLTPTPIQSLPGSLQDTLANLNPDSLKKIKFMYPRSREELLQDVASLHECACGPSAPYSLIIVDGLERYLGVRPDSSPQPEDQSAAAHVSALLADTAAFLTRKLEERGGAYAPCRVIVSFDVGLQGHSGGESLLCMDPILSILDRYFSVRCTLDRDRSSAAPATAIASDKQPRGVWMVYFSGVGVTARLTAGKEESSIMQRQWRLAVCPNGALEFSPMGTDE
ncbi:hypothetical protein AGOR_G00222290 [Albula goreensis]|uniref:SWIM-type zinc finger 7 associated protein 1 n=1 Tax=Albula goreensis TaxID=1534307 RepID=A0A8T3CJ89_9TELE|nr:hypothetical protein AGOR_G00222290 [Albula goreensis]